MRKHAQELLYTFLLGIMLPMIMVAYAVERNPCAVREPLQETSGIQESIPDLDCRLISVIMKDESVCRMKLEDYLVCVLLAELPGEFSLHAKQAQAVVARTYTLRTIAGDKHSGMVCSDSGCCQGYRTIEDYLSNGGSEHAVAQAKMAVNVTCGEVLTYQGNLIEATYFSCSGGRTEDAVAVWGSDVPYLKSVESPGEENASHYTDTVSFARAEFENILSRKLSGAPEKWFSEIRRTSGGGVSQITICGEVYSGTQIRSLFGLRSTDFSVAVENDCIIFTTKGNGHRVGMSQYGAEAMAVQGFSYKQILNHYYPGTVMQNGWSD